MNKIVRILTLILATACMPSALCMKSNSSEVKKTIQFDQLTKTDSSIHDKKTPSIVHYFNIGFIPVGSYMYKIDNKKPNEAVLSTLEVYLEYRKQGIGTELFKDFMQEIMDKHHSVTKITWFATPIDNETSFEQLCRFYRKFGAEIDDYGCASLTLENYKNRMKNLQ